MTAALRQAVILAAGMGTRLPESAVHDRPKGFLEIGGQTLIQQSLGKLKRAGIDEVIVVTGHRRHWYESLADASSDFITTVHNPFYESSGSMYSLYCARHNVEGDFLLLESDLLFERRAIETLLGSAHRDCVLLSGFSESHDEVFVETEGGKLVAMSKNRSKLRSVSGEFVGITRVSSGLYRRMLDLAAQCFRHDLRVDYETDCLAGLAADCDIPCHTVADLAWAEIDDLGHLKRAQETVYPQIRSRDGGEFVITR